MYIYNPGKGNFIFPFFIDLLILVNCFIISFDQTLGIDGVILTKLDGDTRGGAALSIKAITKKPIKYAAVGEKLEDLEQFYPDRMASRILGMGDVMSLIEKAQSAFDEDKAKEMQAKMKSSDFTFDDFLDQCSRLKKWDL